MELGGSMNASDGKGESSAQCCQRVECADGAVDEEEVGEVHGHLSWETAFYERY